MFKKHHVIYVPGIGDDRHRLQSLATFTWWLYGVSGHCHPMPWLGSEAYRSKLNRLLKRIDKYITKGHAVSLVGASAGASAVLNAYAERTSKINGVVLIAAKLNGPETVELSTYNHNPAFKTSLFELQKTLPKLTASDKAKMLSLYSPGDRRVPYEATTVRGIPEQKLPKLDHAQAIIYSLMFGAPSLIGFLQKLNR